MGCGNSSRRFLPGCSAGRCRHTAPHHQLRLALTRPRPPGPARCRRHGVSSVAAPRADACATLVSRFGSSSAARKARTIVAGARERASPLSRLGSVPAARRGEPHVLVPRDRSRPARRWPAGAPRPRGRGNERAISVRIARAQVHGLRDGGADACRVVGHDFNVPVSSAPRVPSAAPLPRPRSSRNPAQRSARARTRGRGSSHQTRLARPKHLTPRRARTSTTPRAASNASPGWRVPAAHESGQRPRSSGRGDCRRRRQPAPVVGREGVSMTPSCQPAPAR